MHDDPYRPATLGRPLHVVRPPAEPASLVGPALVRRARIMAGETLEQFGRRAGVPTRTLSRYENGHAVPRPATLAKLARAAGVSVERLMPDTAA